MTVRYPDDAAAEARAARRQPSRFPAMPFQFKQGKTE